MTVNQRYVLLKNGEAPVDMVRRVENKAQQKVSLQKYVTRLHAHSSWKVTPIKTDNKVVGVAFSEPNHGINTSALYQQFSGKVSQGEHVVVFCNAKTASADYDRLCELFRKMRGLDEKWVDPTKPKSVGSAQVKWVTTHHKMSKEASDLWKAKVAAKDPEVMALIAQKESEKREYAVKMAEWKERNPSPPVKPKARAHHLYRSETKDTADAPKWIDLSPEDRQPYEQRVLVLNANYDADVCKYNEYAVKKCLPTVKVQ